MQAYASEYTIGKNRALTLKNLPFNVGDQVEVIIIPRPESNSEKGRYPFWGKTITYLNPTDPVAETDWDIYK